MEIDLGNKVRTLVDKKIVERLDSAVFVPKGVTGYVCDTEYLKDGFVMVQFNLGDIVGDGTGVYSYKLNEIEICD